MKKVMLFALVAAVLALGVGQTFADCGKCDKKEKSACGAKKDCKDWCCKGQVDECCAEGAECAKKADGKCCGGKAECKAPKACDAKDAGAKDTDAKADGAEAAE